MASTRQICIPVIQPASGTFCPPLLITCIADLQPLEEVWVIIQTPKQRINQLYKSPFMVDEVGRIQISAFVRRPGVCDGPASNAIFELSLNAPPLGKAYAASLMRAVNTTGTGIGGGPAINANSFYSGNSAYVQSGVGNVSDYGERPQQLQLMTGLSTEHASILAPHALRSGNSGGYAATGGQGALAVPTCQFANPVLGKKGPIAVVPHTLQSLKPTDIAVSVCDASGSPIALMDPPTSAVVVLDVAEHSAVLTCKATLEVAGTEATKVLPSFQSLTDLVVTRDTTASLRPRGVHGAFGNSLSIAAPSADPNYSYMLNKSASMGDLAPPLPTMSLGRTSSRVDAAGGLGALGITAPEIGVLSNANGCGIMWRISNIFTGAIGLDEHQNAEDVRRGMRKEIAHSLHFTGNMNVATPGEGMYKISDRTEAMRSVETRSYRVGDCFSLTMRPSGDIDYIHNDRIIFTSRAKSGIETLLSTIVRIAAETATPSVGDIALVPPRSDQRYIIPSLIYNGPSGEGVLRVWLSGREFAPATAKVRLTSSSLPKWAFSTFSVAAMFAVGAFGGDGAHIAESMVATESETLQLFQRNPDAVTGQQYAEKGARKVQSSHADPNNNSTHHRTTRGGEPSPFNAEALEPNTASRVGNKNNASAVAANGMPRQRQDHSRYYTSQAAGGGGGEPSQYAGSKYTVSGRPVGVDPSPPASSIDAYQRSRIDSVLNDGKQQRPQTQQQQYDGDFVGNASPLPRFQRDAVPDDTQQRAQEGGGEGGDYNPTPANPTSTAFQRRLDATFNAGKAQQQQRSNEDAYGERSGSLASLASNKRRALDAVFD